MARRSEAELLAFHESKAEEIRERLARRDLLAGDKRFRTLQRGIAALDKAIDAHGYTMDDRAVLEHAKKILSAAKAERVKAQGKVSA